MKEGMKGEERTQSLKGEIRRGRDRVRKRKGEGEIRREKEMREGKGWERIDR